MPPLWGLGVCVCAFYIDAAPLGLRCLVDALSTQMPPLWGLGVCVCAFYTDAAPLGLRCVAKSGLQTPPTSQNEHLMSKTLHTLFSTATTLPFSYQLKNDLIHQSASEPMTDN